MEHIRKAIKSDVSRIAEILVFNNRLNFLPIFGDIGYSFGEMQVIPIAQGYLAEDERLERVYVYDDGVVKGFVQLSGDEVEKLYVDSFFQNEGIGAKLLSFAVEKGANFLWALEKNVKAVRFYERNGFHPTGEKKFEEGTTEYLIRMVRGNNKQ